jgi:hypothetical protein
MGSDLPKFVNKWFFLMLAISVLGTLIYIVLGLLPTRYLPPYPVGIFLFTITGIAYMFSGAIWVSLYLHHPSGIYCFFCGYDMQAQNEEEPICPECGKSCISEYRQTGWRDTAKQVPGCLFFLVGVFFLFIGGLVIFLLTNGGFE